MRSSGVVSECTIRMAYKSTAWTCKVFLFLCAGLLLSLRESNEVFIPEAASGSHQFNSICLIMKIRLLGLKLSGG